MRNLSRTRGAVVQVMWLLAVLAGLWAVTAPAADEAKPTPASQPVNVGAILTTDGNTESLMALTDGEDAPVKYVFGENFDKKTLKGIFSVSRVQLAYIKTNDTRTLLGIRKEPPVARGTVTGSVTFIGKDTFWIAVKPANGPPDGYALNWPPGANAEKLKGLKIGDTVAIKFHTDFERHRIEAIEVAPPKPAGEPPAAKPPTPASSPRPAVVPAPASRPSPAAVPPVTSQPAQSPEEQARGKLQLVELYIKNGMKNRAKEMLRTILKDYPDTEAAKTAKPKLKELGD